MIARIGDPSDARLAPYRLVADPPALARAGLFAAEGRLIAPRLLASRYRTHSILVSDAALASLQPLIDRHPALDVFVAAGETISTVGGFDFHRGCLALGYRGEPLELAKLLEPGGWSPGPIVILEGINNPDNVGGIFRSAHAFGARAIVLGPHCGDPLYRKAIRTSMGTALEVPWVEATNWPGDVRELHARGYRIIALTTDRSAPPLGNALEGTTQPVALMLGSEGYGLTPEALAAADTLARIPMANDDADSLNVAAAASIALYGYTSIVDGKR